jgi:7 transmembrane receptor (rhodopsin family)
MDNSSVLLEVPYYFWLGDRVGTCVLPIIYVLGFVGNLSSLLTFSAASMRELSCGVLLLLLSISDSLTLVVSVWGFLRSAFKIDLESYSLILCRFHLFLQYIFGQTSSWCLLVLTVDRFLKVVWSVKSKPICKPINALISIGIIFVLLCGLHGHWFSPAVGEVDENGTLLYCGIRNKDYPTYYYYVTQVRVFTDMIVYCFLPGLIMILCNVKIIYEVNRISQAVSTQKSILEHQMRLIMFISVSAFLLTTLPLSIYEILLGKVISQLDNFRRDNHYYMFIHRILGLRAPPTSGSTFFEFFENHIQR